MLFGSKNGPSRCADAENTAQIPTSCGGRSGRPAGQRSAHSRRSAAGCSDSTSAHPERPAGECDADPSMFHGLGGHLATLRWPGSFFSRASSSRSACMFRSAEHALQPAVLVLQALHLADHGCIHAAILRAPLVEGRCAHAMLTAPLGNRHTAAAWRRIARICGSLKLVVFIRISSGSLLRKFYAHSP